MIFQILLFTFTLSNCCTINSIDKKIIRGNYQDVLNFRQINLISTRNTYFDGGQMNSQLNRDAIYYVTNQLGYTYCSPYNSIEIRFFKKYEINTIVIQIWDRYVDVHFDFQVYVSFLDEEKLVYENTSFAGVVRIRFADQFVDKIRFYNRGASNYNIYLTIIKAEAFYNLDH
ncbi:unnamed protein product (macronuclear) [Paramecium tetraurelia]|uniref:H-type lectin domain-containing protein n=1 Tax=Paramecium tetraurelia TaxID=5888 RepID=A0EB51_PARTE|nr:uncharacterized protein GSPATT00025252001 [Paramecium tetraurelia]CAK92518.1 unnamed protein product [Paramecium tetraurelia]|eukprot:XP_001459915.1 hypothetical protein (macronuclear) [Paramecium tetraurelia strain d4-2]